MLKKTMLILACTQQHNDITGSTGIGNIGNYGKTWQVHRKLQKDTERRGRADKSNLFIATHAKYAAKLFIYDVPERQLLLCSVENGIKLSSEFIS